MRIRVATPHHRRYNLLCLAIISALSAPAVSVAAEYQIESFPELAQWNVGSSRSEGFTEKELLAKSGWYGDEYQPFT